MLSSKTKMFCMFFLQNINLLLKNKYRVILTDVKISLCAKNWLDSSNITFWPKMRFTSVLMETLQLLWSPLLPVNKESCMYDFSFALLIVSVLPHLSL